MSWHSRYMLLTRKMNWGTFLTSPHPPPLRWSRETMSIPRILPGTLRGLEWGKKGVEKPPFLCRILPSPSRDTAKNPSDGWALRRQRKAISQWLIFHWEGFNHLWTCDTSVWSSPEAHFPSRTSHLVPKLHDVSMFYTCRQWEQSSCSQRAPSSSFSPSKYD